MVFRIILALLAGACLCLGQTKDSATAESPGYSIEKNPAPATGLLGLIDPQRQWEKAGFTYKQNFFIALDEGEAEKGIYDHDTSSSPNASRPPYTQLSNVWQQDLVFHLTEDVVYRERLRLIMSIEAELNFSMIQRIEYPNSVVPTFLFYPNDMELQYSAGNIQKPWMKIAAGYFPFKYNPDAQNLGEFLLRSSAYPTVITSTPFFPMTRELGFHLSGTSDWLMNPAIDRIRWDALFTSETHGWPTQDWTISALVSNNTLNFVDIGAGVSWQRLLSVNESITTHKELATQFMDANADTSYYTFRSTKVMARAAISPLRFVPDFKIRPPIIFGDHPFFGSQDLKIYGEIAVLGTQNYMAYDSFAQKASINPYTGDSTFSPIPGTGKPSPDSVNYYNNIKDRMPVMLGVNLPTTPLLSYGVLPLLLTKWLYDETGSDLRPLAWVSLVPALASGVLEHFFGWNMGLDELSLEFEWFSQRFTNSDRKAINPNDGIPIPYSNSEWTGAEQLYGWGKAEPTKYSLYFKKTFLDKFAVSGIVGRDHMRPPVFAIPSINQTDDFLKTKANWYWMLRLSANF